MTLGGSSIVRCFRTPDPLDVVVLDAFSREDATRHAGRRTARQDPALEDGSGRHCSRLLTGGCGP